MGHSWSPSPLPLLSTSSQSNAAVSEVLFEIELWRLKKGHKFVSRHIDSVFRLFKRHASQLSKVISQTRKLKFGRYLEDCREEGHGTPRLELLLLMLSRSKHFLVKMQHHLRLLSSINRKLLLAVRRQTLKNIVLDDGRADHQRHSNRRRGRIPMMERIRHLLVSQKHRQEEIDRMTFVVKSYRQLVYSTDQFLRNP